eukprot:gene1807-3505_t
MNINTDLDEVTLDISVVPIDSNLSNVMEDASLGGNSNCNTNDENNCEIRILPSIYFGRCAYGSIFCITQQLAPERIGSNTGLNAPGGILYGGMRSLETHCLKKLLQDFEDLLLYEKDQHFCKSFLNKSTKVNGAEVVDGAFIFSGKDLPHGDQSLYVTDDIGAEISMPMTVKELLYPQLGADYDRMVQKGYDAFMSWDGTYKKKIATHNSQQLSQPILLLQNGHTMKLYQCPAQSSPQTTHPWPNNLPTSPTSTRPIPDIMPHTIPNSYLNRSFCSQTTILIPCRCCHSVGNSNDPFDDKDNLQQPKTTKHDREKGQHGMYFYFDATLI